MAIKGPASSLEEKEKKPKLIIVDTKRSFRLPHYMFDRMDARSVQARGAKLNKKLIPLCSFPLRNSGLI